MVEGKEDPVEQAEAAEDVVLNIEDDVPGRVEKKSFTIPRQCLKLYCN